MSQANLSSRNAMRACSNATESVPPETATRIRLPERTPASLRALAIFERTGDDDARAMGLGFRLCWARKTDNPLRSGDLRSITQQTRGRPALSAGGPPAPLGNGQQGAEARHHSSTAPSDRLR